MSVILSETIVPKAQNVDLFINLAKASDLKISPIRNQVMVLTNQPSKINRENIKVEGCTKLVLFPFSLEFERIFHRKPLNQKLK